MKPKFIPYAKNAKRLYDLETDMRQAIERVINWRVRHLPDIDKNWKENKKEALSQTLFTVLDLYYNNSFYKDAIKEILEVIPLFQKRQEEILGHLTRSLERFIKNRRV